MHQAFRAPFALALLVSAVSAAAEGDDNKPAADSAVQLQPLVVTATRTARPVMELPVSIDAVDGDRIREANPTVNLSESLTLVPGVLVTNRNNYAQDLQISTRGFGTRSTFGVRGLRIIADDIPLSSPDGQGQAATIDLESARSIEVLRGPYSSIYGNASGGVIQVFTEDGPPEATVEATGWIGSHRSNKEGIKFGGQSGAVNYLLDATRFDTEGYRDHSAATRHQENAKLRFTLSPDSTLTLTANNLDQPFTQDPLGLTMAQYHANPRQVDPTAITYDTRKSIENSQGGLVFDHRFSESDSIKLLGYVGTRDIVQYLAIPIGAQSAPSNSGGVVNLDRHFAGAGARWVHNGTIAGAPLTVTTGVDFDNQLETRKGYEDFVGTQLGVQGRLRRNEDDTVYSIGEYVQGELAPTDALRLTLGVRHSEVHFKTEDYYIVPGNGDDSGSKSYDNTSPAAGILWRLSPVFSLYANAGTGFETPAFSELAYKPDGTSGLNFALKPSRSKSYEAGLKALPGENSRVTFALFDVDTRDEIVEATNSGGRSTYQNASPTTRHGAELSIEQDLGSGFTGSLALTYLEASFDDQFTYTTTTTVNGVARTVTTTVAAGNKLPGVPKVGLFGEFVWRSGGFTVGLEAHYAEKMFADDQNLNAAPVYAIFNVRASWRQELDRHWVVTEFARIDNIADRNYIGSVIVNESNGRFFEPGMGRNYMAGVRVAYKF